MTIPPMKRAARRLVRRLGFELTRLPAGTSVPAIPLLAATLKRFEYLSSMYERIKDVPGDLVECGVGRGQSLFMLAYFLRERPYQPRMLWGFDSFQGFPAPTTEDASPRKARAGEWSVSQQEVLTLLQESGIESEALERSIRLVPGFFNESLAQFPKRPIALLHIDADLYQSYRDALSALFPYVVPGGLVLFDEYRTVNRPGATKAIDDYFANTPHHLHYEPQFGKYHLVK